MNSWMPLIALACLASAGGNVFQLYLLRTMKKKPARQSYELQEFLLDLNSTGVGMLEVRRIDPNDVFLRSPKNR